MSETILVVGDALLDRDMEGHAARLAPDAPVPVVSGATTQTRPGGAALAAVLAARDGADVTLMTAVGDDDAGDELRSMLHAEGVRVVDLVRLGGTPEKMRIRADGQSLLRIDRGSEDQSLGKPHMVEEAFQIANVTCLVSDYGAGVTKHPLVRSRLQAAALQMPVVWDPHPRGAEPVAGAKLVTPNRAEAAAAGEVSDTTGSAARAASHLCERWQVNAVAITLGADGAVLGMPGRLPLAIPAPARATQDPCGAGDRFASSAVLGLARGMVLPEAVAAAVVSASSFVASGGVSQLPSSTAVSDNVVDAVRACGGSVVATSGCFDLLHAGHVALLDAARSLGDCLVVLLNSDRSVERLKGAGRPVVPQHDREAVLRSLSCVDVVEIFDEDTPTVALERLRPTLFVKGDDYGAVSIPEEETMRRWGGSVVVVPYLEGRSSSALIAEMHRGR